MAAVTICSDFGAQKNKSDTVSMVSSSISHEVMGPDAMMEEGMATHSSILAWRIPWTEEPGRLQSIGSHHFMGNRWGNSGNSVRLIFLGSKITADGDCSCEIKRHLLLGRKVMTILDSIFKSRDITLPTKVRLVKAMVFL